MSLQMVDGRLLLDVTEFVKIQTSFNEAEGILEGVKEGYRDARQKFRDGGSQEEFDKQKEIWDEVSTMVSRKRQVYMEVVDKLMEELGVKPKEP